MRIPVAREARVHEQRGGPNPAAGQRRDRVVDVLGVPERPVGLLAAVGPAIAVRRRHRFHVRRPRRLPELLRRQIRDRRGDAVIRERRDHAAGAAGDRRGQPPRQVVRLAAGVHEHDRVEPVGHGRGQPFRELERRSVEVARVRVERRGLSRDRLHHGRMRVSDDRHVVVAVEVGATVGVVEPRPAAAHQMERPVVGERRKRRAEQATPAFRQLRDRSIREPRGATRSQRGGHRLPDPPLVLGEPHLVEGIEHRPDAGVPARDVLGVLRVAQHAPRRDHRGGRPSRQQQVGEHCDLFIEERRDRAEPRRGRFEALRNDPVARPSAPRRSTRSRRRAPSAPCPRSR